MQVDFDGLVQACSNSIAKALGLLQSCTKPSILSFVSIFSISVAVCSVWVPLPCLCWTSRSKSSAMPWKESIKNLLLSSQNSPPPPSHHYDEWTQYQRNHSRRPRVSFCSVTSLQPGEASSKCGHYPEALTARGISSFQVSCVKKGPSLLCVIWSPVKQESITGRWSISIPRNG